MWPAITDSWPQWLLIASEFYALGLLGYKTAILLLYVRLFGVNKKFRIACYFVMVFNAGYLLSNIILQIFSCTPVEKYFDPKIPGHCVSLIPPDIVWGCMSMLSDFAIAILPIPMVWNLKLPRRGKLLLSLVFLSGLIAFAVATARWLVGTIDLTVAADRTYLAGVAFLISVLEINTGIICGCTPTFRPLFRFMKTQAHIYRSRRKSHESRRSAESIRRQQTPPPSDRKGHFWRPSAGSHPSVATTVVGTADPFKKDSKSSTSSPLTSANATAPPQRASTPDASPSTLASGYGPEIRKVSTEHSGGLLGPEMSQIPTDRSGIDKIAEVDMIPTDRSGSDKIALPRPSSPALRPPLPAANPSLVFCARGIRATFNFRTSPTHRLPTVAIHPPHIHRQARRTFQALGSTTPSIRARAPASAQRRKVAPTVAARRVAFPARCRRAAVSLPAAGDRAAAGSAGGGARPDARALPREPAQARGRPAESRAGEAGGGGRERGGVGLRLVGIYM